MSKCDLEIFFDRRDRTYRPGDLVRGTVSVEVNKDVHCDGLVLETYWQTHGRGNTATGSKPSMVLFRGDWAAGTRHEYPFQFTAPDGPPTYHGHYLNIDHYVHVRAQIPWALDPKCKEDYLLLPGSRPYGNLPQSDKPRNLTALAGTLGVPLGVLILIVGLLFFPCGLLLVPVALIAIFLGLRKKLAEKKLGRVELQCKAPTVSPGGAVPLRLRFTPRKRCRLNGITAKLTAVERCVSGSGTNRTTHVHRLYQKTMALVDECQLAAKEPVEAEVAVPIPETAAYSFSAPDNELRWELEVRIDIPLWPDWVDKRTLIVRPVAEAVVVETPV
ncbi:MAG TPA: hypothetical protein EYP56_01490, partial [Planctomycetaceae bacterium]|nr:hypothetical protein [Planctomycetaceae bacterium]